MILEGGMVSIACIALTVLHPGMVFRSSWNLKGLAPAEHAGNASFNNKGIPVESVASVELSLNPGMQTTQQYV